MTSSDSESESSHPWPYLQSLFKYIGTSGKTVRMICLLCEPKKTECCAYTNSPSNLKKHVEVRTKKSL